MTEGGDRRKNYAMRRRVEKLIGRVHDARAEIVERGLDAVHDDGERATPDDDADRPPGHDADRPPDAGTAGSPA